MAECGVPKVQNQRVDLLAELASGRLLHVELQSTNDPRMTLRMLDYGVGILRTQGAFPLQLVIYVGNGPLRMGNELQAEGLSYQYSLIDIRNIDGEGLLESPVISDNLIAVLATHVDSVAAIRRIMMKIALLDHGCREDAVRKLLILSGMRGLATTVEHERRNMPVHFDIMDNEVLGPVLRKGLEQGREQGLEEGRQEGREQGREQGLKEGRAEGSRRILRSQLQKRFGALPASVDKRLAACSLTQTDDLALRLFDAKSLADLFGPLG